MSVQLVKSKKTGLMINKTTSGNWFRVQVQGTTNSWNNGFQRISNRTGFAYFQTELAAQNFVAGAVNGVVTGKVVYADQLTPISKEAIGFGLQIPYLMRLNGNELNVEQRIAIQRGAAERGLAWEQSGMPIYRQKFYSPDEAQTDTILSPNNTDEVLAFAATVLSTIGDTDIAAKEARWNELSAIKVAKRTVAEKEEFALLSEQLDK